MDRQGFTPHTYSLRRDPRCRTRVQECERKSLSRQASRAPALGTNPATPRDAPKKRKPTGLGQTAFGGERLEPVGNFAQLLKVSEWHSLTYNIYLSSGKEMASAMARVRIETPADEGPRSHGPRRT